MSEDLPDDSSEMVGELFRVLSRPERRCLLYYLRDRKSATLEELATVVSGWLQARKEEVEVVTPSDRKRIHRSLYHVHLPKLDDAGFVRHDRESGEVALAEVPELFETILDTALAQERDAREARADETTDRHDREER